MPWSGGAFTRTNGVHTGATLWAQDRDAGTKILATRHDTHDQDLADGINSTLEKSGSNAATGNLNIGSNRLTAVADGTAKTDAATVNQIQSNAPAFQATDTGTANAYVVALSPAVTAYAAGQAFTFKAGAASTTASTLNVNGLGTKAIKKLHDQDVASGDIESGSIVTVVYDGTNFQMTSQLATEGGGVTLTGSTNNTVVTVTGSDAIAGEANLTFDGSQLLIPNGSAGAPSISFASDTDSGLYRVNANQLGLTVAGTAAVRWESSCQRMETDGSVSAPVYSFINDSDTGMYLGGTGILRLATAGADAVVVDAAGAVTMPLQPAVLAYSDTVANVSGDGTAYTPANFANEVFDRNADFNNTTFTFTAPVTGVYWCSLKANIGGSLSANTRATARISASNRDIILFDLQGYNVSQPDPAFRTAGGSLIDMDASDTLIIKFYSYNGTKVVDWMSNSFLSIYLVA